MRPARDVALERVRRAYLVARVRAATRFVLIGMAMAGASAIAYGPSVPTASAGIALAVVLGAARGRGRETACRMGISVGLPALVAPVVANDCGGPMGVVYATTCFLVGGGVGVYSVTRPQGATGTIVIATAIAALTGMLGCAAIGFGGACGIVVGSIVARTLERLPDHASN